VAETSPGQVRPGAGWGPTQVKRNPGETSSGRASGRAESRPSPARTRQVADVGHEQPGGNGFSKGRWYPFTGRTSRCAVSDRTQGDTRNTCQGRPSRIMAGAPRNVRRVRRRRLHVNSRDKRRVGPGDHIRDRYGHDPLALGEALRLMTRAVPRQLDQRGQGQKRHQPEGPQSGVASDRPGRQERGKNGLIVRGLLQEQKQHTRRSEGTDGDGQHDRPDSLCHA
jgi:hypothetical protein